MSATLRSTRSKPNRLKFIIGGTLFISAVFIMIFSATQESAQFFLTVDELKASQEDLVGENLRVSGAVFGESIQMDQESGLLHFMIAHIPGDEEEIAARGGLEAVLHQAVTDSENPRLAVSHEGPRPDMLRDEAQAILTGTLNEDGVFIAEELLLKCPTKYEEALPEQVE
ncbi:MAG: cytochrome c maturation protein CcmE [Brevefilum sp.]